MQKLEVQYFGPIQSCGIEIKDFMVFTGPQASGKSTVAKSIFFFNNIKNILFQLVRRTVLRTEEDIMDLALAQRFKKEIRNNFLQVFGTTLAMDPRMRMEYTYEGGDKIEIFLKDYASQRNFAVVIISQGLWTKVCDLEKSIQAGSFSELSEYKTWINREIFRSEYEVVYIPAGRSLITLLSSQINYLYSTMDDIQKRSMDYCTQNYLERILQLKPFFSEGFRQLIGTYKATSDKKIQTDVLELAAELNHRILKGEYKNISGEERLQISPDHFVRINYASSGQQESVWILNVLFYYLLNHLKTFFIIEEPESHLFPAAQKLITEYISLAGNQQNKVVITTHSPYVLGSMNNLLFADRIARRVDREKLEEIVPSHSWLSFGTLGAYFLEDGVLKDITDPEYEDIDHDVIDGVSAEINDAYEAMLALEESWGGGVE